MKNGMVVSKMLKFWLVLAIICTGGAYAHAAGLVDDFDGGADPLFAGTYAVYGEDALGQDASQVTTLRAHSTSHSRFMEQTLNGSQAWGIVLIKSFTSLVDASAYDGGTLDVWFYSDSNNSVLTLDVNLVFSVADGGDGISDYSLKTALEPSLASAYGQWIKLSIPLTTASFDVENFGAFDLSSLSQIKFLIKNNGQPKPAAKIYLDDIQFTGSADSTPPTISYTAPSTGGEVFPTTTPTINGLLSDDDSGIDTASLAISIDGVPQSGAMVLPESFSFTVASPLADAVTHTSVVVVSDNAGNTQTATTTFAVNSSLVQEDLLNPGFEYGDGVSLANWGKFGDAAQAFDGPRSGSAHGRLLGNYPGNNSQNYSGFYQTLPAAPGDIWSAGVYAQVAQALGANNEALLQLIYVNGAGETVPGGVNDSAAKLTAATPVGTYAQLTASGQAPAGTEGVKVVLLLIQRNEGAGLVYFDDASIQKQTLPSGPALPANTLVDDFSSVTLYHSQHVNDLGYYTDDDATLAVESVTNGMLTAQWSGDAYWYTLLAPNDGSASLTNNTYLSMRYRGHSGGETFNITLREAGGMTATIACDPIVGVQAHTVNYPLSDFAALALNIQDIRTLSLGFAAATPGTISIDGIGLSAYARPDSINLVAPSMVTGSVPFSAQVTVSDASGVMTDFSGTLNLRVSEGTVSPATVSNFVNGVATVNIVVDGALNTVLYAEDELGAAGSEALTVDTVLPPPSLSNPGFEEGEGPVPYSWEAFGERMRDAATPYVGSYAGRLTGNFPGNGSQNYSGFYQTLPAAPGQRWQAAAFASITEALGNGNEAFVQLIFVDGAGETLPGGVNDSSTKLDTSSVAGIYTQFIAEGRAPAGTEGAKIVLLYIQRNDSAGAVCFDEVVLVETTPVGAALPANALVDDFDDEQQYRSQENDLGYYTDDDATMSAEAVSNGLLTLEWDADAYWYTLLADATESTDLGNNGYLSMRYRGHNGNETFTIRLSEPDGYASTLTCAPITDTSMRTVCYPLSQFTALGANIRDVRTLSLGFAGASAGGLDIDGIAITEYAYPSTINISAPSMVTGGAPFTVDITVSDAGGVITNFNGSLALSVTAGSITPSTVSGFVNGSASVQVTLDGAMETTLSASDLLGCAGVAEIEVATEPPAPMHLLSGTGSGAIALTWDAVAGADGYRVYRRQDGLMSDGSDLLAVITDPMTLSFTDSTALEEKTYFYRVAAYNGIGEGELSDVAIGTKYAQSWAPAPTVAGGLTMICRQEGDRLLLQTQQGDIPFIAGVDIGASIPGYSPGAMAAPAELYRKWFSQIAGLGFRGIRVYTLHRPAFYDELLAYNTANPDAPLYLYHGVWLIEENYFHTNQNLFASRMINSFKTEISDVVQAIHGELVRTDQSAYPGQAIGTYTSDVSPWCAGYIIGIEMEPDPTLASDILNAAVPPYAGTYFASAPGASPTEIWYAEMFDHLATEMATRGRAAPISTSNYSTTDPLIHLSEPSDYENMVGINLNNIQSTAGWPAGHFANYHSYPYFPNSLRYEEDFTNFVFRGRSDGYAGYLKKLKEHHSGGGIPLFISEFGVPSSIGNAHYGPLGRDQGNHSEQEQMATNVDLLDIIRNLKMSGGFVFMWQGEWFKTVWNTKDYHIPAGRRPYWQNLWANEANFGLVNGEPGERMAVIVDGNDSEWSDNGSQVIFSGAAGDPVQEVRAIHDEGFLYLRILTDNPNVWMNDKVTVGLDVLPGGNQGLPDNPGLGVDAEYAVSFGPGNDGRAWIAAWNDYPTIKFAVNGGNWDVDPADVVFESGVWNQQILVANRKTILPTTGEELPAEIFPVGELHFGPTDPEDPTFDSRNTWMANGNVIEVRLPYAQIGFGDPSQLDAFKVYPDGTVDVVRVSGVGITLAADDTEFTTTGYTWPAWNTVKWHQRIKVDVHVLAEAVVDANRNVAPIIESAPVTSVMAGNNYSYDVEAVDSNTLELLEYSLLQGPAGMTIDPTSGLIHWETSADVLGDHTVEVQVSDSLGLTDTQQFTLSVVPYTMHLAYDPDTGIDSFPQATAEVSNYTGAASIWMTAKYLFGNDYNNNQAQIYGLTTHDPAHNGEITPLSYASHLNGIDFPNYYFSARTRTNLNEAICEAIYWVDFLPLGGLHSPSAVLSGTNWAYKLIRGFQTDEKPYRAGAASTDMTVFGVWVNDPVMNGLGNNIFVPANGLSEVFHPSEADGNYHLVAEPPVGEEFDQYMQSMSQKTIIMQPAKTSVAMSDALNEVLQGGNGPAMQGTRGLRDQSDTDLHALLVDVLPDTLQDDPVFAAVYDAATLVRSYPVNQDTPADSYVLLAGAYRGSASTAYVVKMNPNDGSVVQIAWGRTSRYLPVDRQAAEWSARQQLGFPDAVLESAKLVYSPETCSSPFLPRWELVFQMSGSGSQTVHIGQHYDLSGDQDGDGIEDGMELYAGTDPMNGQSALQMSGQAVTNMQGEAFVIEWTSETGKTYSVGRSFNLSNGFTLEATGLPSTPPMNAYTAAPPASLTFYRIEVD